MIRSPTLRAWTHCLLGHLGATTLVGLGAAAGFDLLGITFTIAHVPLGAPIVGAIATVPFYEAAKRADLRVDPMLLLGAAACATAGIAWYWACQYPVTLIRYGISPAELPFGAWLELTTGRLNLEALNSGRTVRARGGEAVGWFAIQALLYVAGGVAAARGLGSAWRCPTCDQYQRRWPVAWVETREAADAALTRADQGEVVAWDQAALPRAPGPPGERRYELRAIGCPLCGVGYLSLWEHGARRPTYLRQERVGPAIGARLVAAR